MKCNCHMIRDNPKITAKMIAQKMGIGLSAVHYRMNVLKREGRIRFCGGGGVGYWEILE